MKSFKNIWFLSLFIKLILAALIPLSADEAYYWVWSHKLQLSFFDHPPMVAWLFYLGHFLEPVLNMVRWPAVLLGHSTLGVGVLLLKNVLSENQMRWWIYLVLFSPLLGFGSLIVTPDLPVIFFWVLSLYIFKLALEKKKPIDYFTLGAALGLGFCSKYHIVLFIPCLLLFLVFEKAWGLVRWKLVPLTLFSGLIFCSPVILWNIQNDFASFKFQLDHGLNEITYNPQWTADYVLGQVIIIFPLMIWAALKAKLPSNIKFLYYFTWPPLVFFLITSFKAPVEANWPIIALPSLCALAVFHPKIQSWLRIYIGFWATLITAILIIIFSPLVKKSDPKLREPYELKNLSYLAKQYQPLYGSSYQVAASLWYFSKVPVFKLAEMSRPDYFDTFPEAHPDGTHFYLLKHKLNDLPQWLDQQKWSQTKIQHYFSDYDLLEFKRL